MEAPFKKNAHLKICALFFGQIFRFFGFLFLSLNFCAYAVEQSTAEVDFHNESKVFDFHNILSFYQPSYFLVFYHNESPDYEMYAGKTPANAKLAKNEAKVQFSAYLPLLRSIFGNDDIRLYFAYTQLFLWQIYNSRTLYIREVNYEPIFWIRYHFRENMFANLQLDHQSNGKGGYMEISWNRVIGYAEFTSKNWYAQINLWVPFWILYPKHHSSHDLAYYLGYDRIVLSYNWKDIVLSVEGQNLESGFTRGHIMASISYAATSRVKLYLQYFRGYGQTLIEYDHRTTSYGVGIALSDWQ